MTMVRLPWRMWPRSGFGEAVTRMNADEMLCMPGCAKRYWFLSSMRKPTWPAGTKSSVCVQWYAQQPRGPRRK